MANDETVNSKKIIDLKLITQNFSFQDLNIFEMNAMDRQFVLSNQKDREDLIQIQLNGVSVVWDLDQNEEITVLIGADNQFDVKNFVRTGHLLKFTK